MAGNQTDARKSAEWNLKEAKKANASPKTIAILQADYDAARSLELSATGKNEQARGPF